MGKLNPGIAIANLIADPIYGAIYIVRLNNNGNFVWAKQIGATDSR